MRDRDHRHIQYRILSIFVLILLGMGVVGARAYQLQIRDGEQLYQMAINQTLGSIVIQPRRGQIMDRHGRILATNQSVFSLAAQPRGMSPEERDTAKRLIQKLFHSSPEVLARLDSDRYFVWIERHLSTEQADVFQRVMAKLPDTIRPRRLSLVEEPKRTYEGLAPQVVGFTGLEMDGLMGIERRYNDVLRGSSLKVTGIRDPSGNVAMDSLDRTLDIPAGDSVVLTIDGRVQSIAEDAIRNSVKEFSATKGVVSATKGVVMVIEPRTGAIRAMAQYPAFDPNHLSETPQEALHNEGIEHSFEPGSALKPFIIAGAIDEGLHSPSETLFCHNGEWALGPMIIHDVHPYGYMSLTEVLSKSSNICTAKIGIGLGYQKVYGLLKNLGFGERSGIPLPGESAGLLSQPKKWMPIDLANISFGQGLNVTPLQLAFAMGAIANGGTLMRPRIVERIESRDGTVMAEYPPEALRRVMSEETAAQMVRMLTVAVNEGTGKNAQVEGCSVAGKTGTAEKLAKNAKYGVHDFYTSTFIGFFPAEQPALLILVVVDEPRGDKFYGGEVAAPAFNRIATEAVPVLGLCSTPAGKLAEAL